MVKYQCDTGRLGLSQSPSGVPSHSSGQGSLCRSPQKVARLTWWGVCEPRSWSRAHPEAPLSTCIFPPPVRKGAEVTWERRTTTVTVQTLEVSAGSGELCCPLRTTLFRLEAVPPHHPGYPPRREFSSHFMAHSPSSGR